MKVQCPFPRILLPVSGSEDSKRAVEFTGCIGGLLDQGPSLITLLRVIAGGYLSHHLGNIDFRAEEIVKHSEIFKRAKEEHLAQNIMPMLNDMETLLRKLGISADIAKLTAEGDPTNEIVRIAEEGGYTTIVLARKGPSEPGASIGGITNKVIHAATGHTVYIVGQNVIKTGECPIQRILVPVDGSAYSREGVRHAARLASGLKGFGSVTLLRVINLALFMDRMKEGLDPERESREILDQGKDIFIREGVPETLVATKIRTGTPGDEIIKETLEEDYGLVMMGRKGRSSFKDLILGGASWKVLQHCERPTIAIVSSE